MSTLSSFSSNPKITQSTEIPISPSLCKLLQYGFDIFSLWQFFRAHTLKFVTAVQRSKYNPDPLNFVLPTLLIQYDPPLIFILIQWTTLKYTNAAHRKKSFKPECMYTPEQTRQLQELSKSLLKKLTQKSLNIKDLASLRNVLVFHEYRYYILNDPLLSDTEYDTLYKVSRKTGI